MKLLNKSIVDSYVEGIIAGRIIACKELIQACQRYKNDIASELWDFKPKEAEDIINIIEKTFVLLQGEDLEGESFRDRPFILQTWQKFIVYNLFGFFVKGKKIRRFEEAFVFVPKKNGKTPFAGALAFAFGLKYCNSESNIILTSYTLKQALYSFRFIIKNLEKLKLTSGCRIRDNNQEHIIDMPVGDGEIRILAVSGDPQDGLNGNFVIADEMHEYRDADQYLYYQKAMKAYRNKLMIGITTAGDDTTSFCYNRLKTCQSILSGHYKNDKYFVFICKADETEGTEIDILDPMQHKKANPSYDVTVTAEDIMNSALLAKAEPQTKLSFLCKELNIYVQSLKAYFNIEKFIESDKKYNWSIDDLAKLPITWYGGTDLSKIKDLTAACLYGHYNGVDIIIPHCWFPITQAYAKAEKDSIPLFGWLEDGWLTMCNGSTINHHDVINWYDSMMKKGFKIKEIRYDRRYGEEYVENSKRYRQNVVDQPQLYTKTTKGFNRIDKMAEDGFLYYCHSEAFEYCVKNVMVAEKAGGFKEFQKVAENKRIDIFASAVFAVTGMIETAAMLQKQIRQLEI